MTWLRRTSPGRREKLRRILADGEWHAQKDVEDARDAAGISYGTLRRAKDSLGVESRKFGSAWKWRMSKVLTLPGTAHLSTLACSSASNTEGEHLHSNNINMLGGEDAKGLTGTQGAPLAHLDPSESLTEEVL
jgi:hypothetical protein